MAPDGVLGYLAHGLAEFLALFLRGSSFLSAGPLAVALAIALAVLIAREKRRAGRIGGSGLRRVLAELFARRIYLHPSAKRDYAVLAINHGFLFFLTASALVTPVVVTEFLTEAAAREGYAIAAPEPDLALRVAFTVVLLLVWDFAATFAHFLNHKVPILWEFHKVHHSAEVLTPATALRRHPVEALTGGFMTIFALGLATALWLVAIGDCGGIYTVFGMSAGLFAWRLLGYNLRHSHVWLSYGPFWNRVLISPAQHQIHHSVEPRHHDRNFGHIFAFWDALFRTLYLPKPDERFALGIAASEMPDYRSVPKLYVVPFAKAAALIGRREGVLRSLGR
ncbi:MAG TPA: sterol desaturase family protein [Alphaproteobacteria bacterium]